MNLELLLQIVGPVLVIFVTQLIKKSETIQINSGDKVKLRTLAGILSFLAAGITAFLSGDLQSFVTPDMIQIGVDSAINFIFAYFGYKAFVKPTQ